MINFQGYIDKCLEQFQENNEDALKGLTELFELQCFVSQANLDCYAGHWLTFRVEAKNVAGTIRRIRNPLKRHLPKGIKFDTIDTCIDKLDRAVDLATTHNRAKGFKVDRSAILDLLNSVMGIYNSHVYDNVDYYARVVLKAKIKEVDI